MKNYFLAGLTNPPSKATALTSGLGYCFGVVFLILLVLSSTMTQAYEKVVQQERADMLIVVATSSALAMSDTNLHDVVTIPISFVPPEMKDINYTYNIYIAAGNSFLRVYTSDPQDQQLVAVEQVTLSGAGAEYAQVFEQQIAVVSPRYDELRDKYWVSGVAPIINSDGMGAGLMEVSMPADDFYAIDSGISLAWFFAVLSIAVALTIIFYQTHKLLQMLFVKPDRHLPMIIRYGLPGASSIAFSSAVGLSMMALSITPFVRKHISQDEHPLQLTAFIFIAGVLFAVGFFGFNDLRSKLVMRLTSRIAMTVSLLIGVFFMLLMSVFSNPYVYLILLLPTSFFLGMLFYFQREYRIYAGRLNYESFSEQRIARTQYVGNFLGLCVGAVFTGILFERFGLLVVVIVSAIVLLFAALLSLAMVRHCPDSGERPVPLVQLVYALRNRRSGSYLTSFVLTLGVQIAFFVLFVPRFVMSLGLSTVTVAFYFVIFSFLNHVVMHLLLGKMIRRTSTKKRLFAAGLLQTFGFLLLAIFPNAKILVLVVALFGISLGLHDFSHGPAYQSMIRDDKRLAARRIIEQTVVVGVALGALLLGSVFFIPQIRVGLLILTVLMGVMLLMHPLAAVLFPASGQRDDDDEPSDKAQMGGARHD